MESNSDRIRFEVLCFNHFVSNLKTKRSKSLKWYGYFSLGDIGTVHMDRLRTDQRRRRLSETVREKGA